MRKYINLRANIALGLIFAFLANTFGPLPLAQAQDFTLPAPGAMVGLSPEFNPPILKGIKVHPDNPFRFDFILDVGDGSKPSPKGRVMNPPLQKESIKLIKCFLASLTIPEQDLWVNLSPYEKNRIVPPSFGQTEMGRDLLAEDYMLKQITASLIYPEGETGKKFWKRIYEEAAKKFGTTNIPVNTFNKVWIVPEKAIVYENAKAGTAYVVEAKLKVMLEQDYLAFEKNSVIPAKAGIQNRINSDMDPRFRGDDMHSMASQVIRQIVIPELSKEVNEGKNFSQLRQVYNSLILATWYKKKIKDSILEQVYADKKKVAGIGYEKYLSSPNVLVGDPEYIYQQYLKAFKKGVYNYIKEDIDPVTQESTPRKYFSGGVSLAMTSLNTNSAMQVTDVQPIGLLGSKKTVLVEMRADAAMTGPSSPHDVRPIQRLIQKGISSKVSRLGKSYLSRRIISLVTGCVSWGAPFLFYKTTNEYISNPFRLIFTLAIGVEIRKILHKMKVNLYNNTTVGRYTITKREANNRLSIHVKLNLDVLKKHRFIAYQLIFRDVLNVLKEIIKDEDGKFADIKEIVIKSPLLVKEENAGDSARFSGFIQEKMDALGVRGEVYKRNFAKTMSIKFMNSILWGSSKKSWTGKFELDISTPEKKRLLLNKINELSGSDPAMTDEAMMSIAFSWEDAKKFISDVPKENYEISVDASSDERRKAYFGISDPKLIESFFTDQHVLNNIGYIKTFGASRGHSNWRWDIGEAISDATKRFGHAGLVIEVTGDMVNDRSTDNSYPEIIPLFSTYDDIQRVWVASAENIQDIRAKKVRMREFVFPGMKSILEAMIQNKMPLSKIATEAQETLDNENLIFENIIRPEGNEDYPSGIYVISEGIDSKIRDTVGVLIELKDQAEPLSNGKAEHYRGLLEKNRTSLESLIDMLAKDIPVLNKYPVIRNKLFKDDSPLRRAVDIIQQVREALKDRAMTGVGRGGQESQVNQAMINGTDKYLEQQLFALRDLFGPIDKNSESFVQVLREVVGEKQAFDFEKLVASPFFSFFYTAYGNMFHVTLSQGEAEGLLTKGAYQYRGKDAESHFGFGNELGDVPGLFYSKWRDKGMPPLILIISTDFFNRHARYGQARIDLSKDFHERYFSFAPGMTLRLTDVEHIVMDRSLFEAMKSSILPEARPKIILYDFPPMSDQFQPYMVKEGLRANVLKPNGIIEARPTEERATPPRFAFYGMDPQGQDPISKEILCLMMPEMKQVRETLLANRSRVLQLVQEINQSNRVGMRKQGEPPNEGKVKKAVGAWNSAQLSREDHETKAGERRKPDAEMQSILKEYFPNLEEGVVRKFLEIPQSADIEKIIARPMMAGPGRQVFQNTVLWNDGGREGKSLYYAKHKIGDYERMNAWEAKKLGLTPDFLTDHYGWFYQRPAKGMPLSDIKVSDDNLLKIVRIFAKALWELHRKGKITHGDLDSYPILGVYSPILLRHVFISDLEMDHPGIQFIDFGNSRKDGDFNDEREKVIKNLYTLKPLGSKIDNTIIRQVFDKNYKADAAMNGGIDLTPANMNLQTQNPGGAIKFHMDAAMLRQLQNAPGFVPVIINIQPLLNIRDFLGIKARVHNAEIS